MFSPFALSWVLSRTAAAGADEKRTCKLTISNIRVATLNDAAAIADLATQLGYPTATVLSADRLGTILARDEHAVLVAVISDRSLVGWIHVFEAHRVESDRFAELGGFVVAEQYRGCGIGRSLLSAAEEWVVARGMAKLRARTRSDRVGAHNFYERFGFELTKQQHVYDLVIGPS